LADAPTIWITSALPWSFTNTVNTSSTYSAGVRGKAGHFPVTPPEAATTWLSGSKAILHIARAVSDTGWDELLGLVHLLRSAGTHDGRE
jgi:hypothetical protein